MNVTSLNELVQSFNMAPPCNEERRKFKVHEAADVAWLAVSSG